MNKRQRKIGALAVYFKRAIAEPKIDGLHSDFNSAVIFALNTLEMQFADDPAIGYEMDKELKELGFYPPGTKGTCGCPTIPCFGGKMPDENLPVVGCAIGGTMCSQSPRQSMRDAKAFSTMEVKLKEQQRLGRNARARKLYAKKIRECSGAKDCGCAGL